MFGFGMLPHLGDWGYRFATFGDKGRKEYDSGKKFIAPILSFLVLASRGPRTANFGF